MPKYHMARGRFAKHDGSKKDPQAERASTYLYVDDVHVKLTAARRHAHGRSKAEKTDANDIACVPRMRSTLVA